MLAALVSALDVLVVSTLALDAVLFAHDLPAEAFLADGRAVRAHHAAALHASQEGAEYLHAIRVEAAQLLDLLHSLLTYMLLRNSTCADLAC